MMKYIDSMNLITNFHTLPKRWSFFRYVTGVPISIRKALNTFLIIFFAICGQSQDTLPPIIVSPAIDTGFACNTPDIITKFNDWYNHGGYAQATDDSGEQPLFVGHISRDSALFVFNTSSDTLCGHTQSVTVTFYAVDAAGNQSLSTTAKFYTEDNQPPTINSVPNVAYSCQVGIRDTLIQWIRNKGGYTATDACSDSVRWTRFLYSISHNNIPIQSGSGLIESGPYPAIPDSICEWRLNINFFALDDCGNEIRTPGTTAFSVTDDVAPVFVNPPKDTIVSCDHVPLPNIQVVDFCDRSPNITLTVNSTQGSDSTFCSHYSYTLIRMWTATDACQNSSKYIQVITVRDTTPPKVIKNDIQNLTCIAYDTLKTKNLIEVKDNCSYPNITFHDSITISGCLTQYSRKYVLKDVCLNTDTVIQEINVRKNINPTIVSTARSLSVHCDASVSIQDSLIQWIATKGSSNGEGVCNDAQYFIAEHGSYDLLDSSTYPGKLPVTFPPNACPSDVTGYLARLQLDVVYFDTCGNASYTTGFLGVVDTIPPTLSNCQSELLLNTDPLACERKVSLAIPKVNDACVDEESPIIRKIKVPLVSDDSGSQTSIVHTAILNIGPLNPAATILTDGFVHLKINNADIDDATEFFTIYSEDEDVLGTTPVGIGQCASTNFDVTIPKSKLETWASDGYITLKFVPNIVPDNAVLSVNDICNGSSIEATLQYDVDVKNTITKWYRLDSGDRIKLSSALDSLELVLAAGEHIFTYGMEDCARNVSTCETYIKIEDKTAPEIDCPADITCFVTADSCQKNVTLPLDIEVSESCGGNIKYETFNPISKEASLISFQYNSTTQTHDARSKQLVFNNLFPIRHLSNEVKLEIFYFGQNNDVNTFFDIYGPGGYYLGKTVVRQDSTVCGLSTNEFFIPAPLFNTWISNNQISFAAVPNRENNLVTIHPCEPLMPNQTLDNESYLQGKLSYSDVNFQLKVSNATNIPTFALPQSAISKSLLLNVGENIVTISAEDKFGNLGNCHLNVIVKDTIKPIAKCKNAILIADPSGTESTAVNIDLIEDGSTDNCSSLEFRTIPESIDCSFVGSDQKMVLLAEDSHGNIDSCMSLVRVITKELKPSFSSGLCANDTLKFSANVETIGDSGTLTYHWKGNNGIEFFTENPTIPNADISYNGVYILTVTGFNGCTSQGTVTVNINPITKPALTSVQTTYCEDEKIVLTATRYSGNIKYKWFEGIYPTGVLIAENSNNEVIVTPTIGVHFYYVIVDGPGCTSEPSTVLKITSLKTPAIGVDESFLTPCEGDNITFSTSISNPNYTYLWSGPSGYTYTGQFPPSIQDVNKTHEGKYQLVIKNGSCISDTASIIVTVFEKPSIPTISGNTVFCIDGTMILTSSNASNADKFEWTLNGQVFRVTQQNILNLTNVQTTFEGNWQVRAIKGNCASAISSPKQVVIEDLSEISVSSDSPICDGDSLQLLVSYIPDASYNWQGPISNIPSVYNPKISGKAGIYVVTVSTPSGCTNTLSTSIDIISVPTITALSHDAGLCVPKGSTITLSPSVFPDGSNYSYFWSGPNGYISSDRNASITKVEQDVSGTYALHIQNNGCNSESKTIDVNFTIIPDQPKIYGDTSYCDGQIISLKTNALDNQVYAWNTPLGTVKTDTSVIDIWFVSVHHSGYYSLNVINNGCSSEESDKIFVHVFPKPAAPSINISPNPICFGDDLTLSTANLPNVTYHWNGPNNFVSSDHSTIIKNVTQENSGVYFLSVEANGCFSDTIQSMEVIVSPEIKVPQAIDKLINICSTDDTRPKICFEPATLQLNGNFVLFDGQGQFITQTRNQCISIPDGYSLMDGSNYFVIKTLMNGCYSAPSALVIINKNTPPEFKASALESYIVTCPQEDLRLTSLYGAPIVDVRWYSADPNIQFSDINNISTFVSQLSDGENIIYLSYSSLGCIDYSIDTVKIVKEAAPTAIDDAYSISYSGELLPVLDNDQVFGDVYLESVNSNFGTAVIDGNSIFYTFNLSNFEDVILTYKVCTQYCQLCDEAKVTLNLDDGVECKIPNIITPNNDGINDHLLIPCLLSDKFKNNTLTIFNEWGSEVFSASPYKNDWNGTYNNNELPVGTYFYILDIDGIKKPFNGFIILQR